MKIVILGAGALGTVLGAHLARAGEDVTLLARGQRAAYLAKSKLPTGSFAATRIRDVPRLWRGKGST